MPSGSRAAWVTVAALPQCSACRRHVVTRLPLANFAWITLPVRLLTLPWEQQERLVRPYGRSTAVWGALTASHLMSGGKQVFASRSEQESDCCHFRCCTADIASAVMEFRKRKPLSPKKTLAIIEKDPKRKQIELGLSASTVNTILSKHKEIEPNT